MPNLQLKLNMFKSVKNALIYILIYVNLALIAYAAHLKYRLGEFTTGGPYNPPVRIEQLTIEREEPPSAKCELIPQKPPVKHKDKAQLPNLVGKLNHLFKGKLSGKGSSVVSIANKYGIDPKLLAAICIHESAYGTSKNAIYYNNVTGSLKYDGKRWSPRYFNSVEDCFEFTAKNLKKNYIDVGLKTVAAIGRKYCPVITNRKSKDFNDPKSLNSHWVPAIEKFIEQLDAA